MSNPTQPSARWAIPFFTLWSGQALSLLGTRIAGFALVWWLTQTTGSAVVLATSTLLFMLPQIVLGPFIGALIDRWNRRLVMLAADVVTALASLALALLFWSDQLQVWHVFITTFISSVCSAFHFAAMTASTTLLAPEQHLTRVQGVNQMLQGLLGIFAPPTGALLLGVLPFATIMALDVVTAVFAIGPLLFIAIPQPPRQANPQASPQSSLWGEVQGGLRYIWGWPSMLMLILIAMLVNIMAIPTISLTPILVTQHFQGNALQLSWMDLAFGLGMLGGGILLSVWGGFKRRMLMMPLGLLGFGVGCLLIGFSPASAFWMGLTGMAIFGIMSSMINGTLMAIMQATVAPAMQGRVFAVLSSGSGAATPLGLLIAGPFAEAFGPQFWFVLAGVVVTLTGFGVFLLPAILNLESQRPADAQQGEQTIQNLTQNV